jgi:hypothetical protein
MRGFVTKNMWGESCVSVPFTRRHLWFMNVRVYCSFIRAPFERCLAKLVFVTHLLRQVVLGPGVKGDEAFFGGFLNICLGYGLALMIGILVSGGVRHAGSHWQRTPYYI